MQFVRVTAFILMVTAVTAVGWQLEKSAEDSMEKHAPDRPPTEQHGENKISEPREPAGQNHAVHTVPQEEIETRYTVQLMNTAQNYEDRLLDIGKTAWKEYATTQKEGKSLSKLAFTYFRKENQNSKSRLLRSSHSIKIRDQRISPSKSGDLCWYLQLFCN